MKVKLKFLTKNFVNKNEEAINAIEYESKKRLENIYKEDFKNKGVQTIMAMGTEACSFEDQEIQATTFMFSKHIQTEFESSYLAPSVKSDKDWKSRKYSSIESEKYDIIEVGSLEGYDNDGDNLEENSSKNTTLHQDIIKIEQITQTEFEKNTREWSIQVDIKIHEFFNKEIQTDQIEMNDTPKPVKGIRNRPISDYCNYYYYKIINLF